MIVYFPFLFSNFSFWCMQIVYTTMCTTSPWNFTGIWHTGRCCPDIRYFTKYTSGIYCILWEFQHVTGLISYGWYSEVYSSHYISLLYDYTLMSTQFHCIYSLYTVYTLCWHSHIGFIQLLRIRNVYIWYTYSTHLSTKRYIVYTTCIYPVSFFYDACMTIAQLCFFKHNIFLLSQ